VKYHTWIDRCFSIKIITRIGLLKVVEFTINLSDPSPPPLLEKSVDPLFISFVSSLLAFSQTIEATTLAQLTFSPFSYAI
jgi:hypothetical protein